MFKVRRFTARFDSECNNCLSDIYEGDEAGYVAGEVCCEACCDEADFSGSWTLPSRSSSTTYGSRSVIGELVAKEVAKELRRIAALDEINYVKLPSLYLREAADSYDPDLP